MNKIFFSIITPFLKFGYYLGNERNNGLGCEIGINIIDVFLRDVFLRSRSIKVDLSSNNFINQSGSFLLSLS